MPRPDTMARQSRTVGVPAKSAGEKLKAPAAKAGVTAEKVNKLSDQHTANMAELEKAKTAEFDALFVEMQEKAHVDAVHYSGSTPRPVTIRYCVASPRKRSPPSRCTFPL